MSAIFHRVFISKNKGKKKFKGPKPTYKKFIGIKTLKVVTRKKRSVKNREIMIRKDLAKAVKALKGFSGTKPQRHKSARVKRTHRYTPSPLLWLGLHAQERVNEIKSFKSDVKAFFNHFSTAEAGPELESTFQAYLPKEIWDKMTWDQRGEHLQKRKELAAKGVLNKNFTKPARPSIFKFSSKESRSMLGIMSFNHRRAYLKTAIEIAKTLHKEASNTAGQGRNKILQNPNLIAETSNAKDRATKKKIKTDLMKGKKIKREQVALYTNLTYKSILLPKNMHLFFENAKNIKI